MQLEPRVPMQEAGKTPLAELELAAKKRQDGRNDDYETHNLALNH